MINLYKISKKYENGNLAINDISLNFGATGFVAIVGASGSGKSTLLNLLSSNDIPTSGHISFNSIEYPQIAQQKKLNDFAYIYQDYKLIENVTVYENIKFAVELSENSNENTIISDTLAKVNLTEFANSKVVNLSGGQKQRVAIARAIARQPKVLFADEPTGNLDKENSHNIFQLLKNISQEKLVIVVTHDTDLAQKYCDRIVKLDYGEIIEDHTINKIQPETSKNSNIQPKQKTKKNKLSFSSQLSIAKAFNRGKKLTRTITLIMSILIAMLTVICTTFTMLNYEQSAFITMKKSNSDAFGISARCQYDNMTECDVDLTLLQEELINKLDINSAFVYSSNYIFGNTSQSYPDNPNRPTHREDINGRPINLVEMAISIKAYNEKYILASNDISKFNLNLIHGRQATGYKEALIPKSYMDFLLNFRDFNVRISSSEYTTITFNSEEDVYNYPFKDYTVVGVFDDKLDMPKQFYSTAAYSDARKDKGLKVIENKRELEELIDTSKSILNDNNILPNCIIVSESTLQNAKINYYYHNQQGNNRVGDSVRVYYTNEEKSFDRHNFAAANEENIIKHNITTYLAENEIAVSQDFINMYEKNTDTALSVGSKINLKIEKGYYANSLISPLPIWTPNDELASGEFIIKEILSNNEVNKQKLIFFNENKISDFMSKANFAGKVLLTNYENLTLSDVNHIKDFVTKQYKPKGNIYYHHNNMEGLSLIIETMSIIADYITLPLLIVIFCLLVLFISKNYIDMIKAKAGDILILKSLNVTKTDLLKIFSLHCAMFLSLTLILGIGLGIGGVAMLDYVISKVLGNKLYTALPIDPISILICITITIFTNVIALLVNVLLINDKNLRKAFQKAKE